ncbi:MAG: gamma carbonic anhydrase family protein [Acidimicrobiaceae bacterium]|nr:gamma carbonic anhydrase family protein [Acidimicrobiaceae bacterium]
MAVYALGDVTPSIDPSAFVHPDAVVIGRVSIGPQSSVWPGAVLRGDYGEIRVGARTSIQDGAILHATAELPTVIGDDCVVGHLAHLEGCVVDDGSLIGSGSVVLHEVQVGAGATIAAGAVVRNRTVVPARALAVGVPAEIRPDRSDPVEIARGAALYVSNTARYRTELRRVD